MTSPKRVFLGLSLMASLATPLQAGDTLTKTGDVLQILLPAMAEICAIRQGTGTEFAAGFVTSEIVTHGLKAGLGNTAINQRPDGGGHGMPSGHTAMAVFGAISLARKCLHDKPVLGAIAYGAAAVVAASRVDAHKHTAGQVAAGALVGYLANGVTADFSSGRVALGYSMTF
ncbi:MAG: phosphatase PAP2 family protein [Rhodobacteraceae bacterium]|nr:phosphatase PAP2 family protein [Paracoccaceae bacterium]MCF8516592.1 phosphatase PAP2 family protein [Paracoccaceae bacterium]MCF8520933.1 phosphatase PAP2 family protein [Paracoccaceae bacterium]